MTTVVIGLWVLFLILALGGTILLSGLLADMGAFAVAYLLGTLVLALLVTLLIRLRDMEKKMDEQSATLLRRLTWWEDEQRAKEQKENEEQDRQA